MVDSDDPSYVFSLTLDGKGGAALDKAPASDDWIHIDYSHPTSESVLESLGVPSVVVDSILRADTRPKVTRFEDGVLLIVRAINANPGSDPEDMVSLRVWIEDKRLITIRQRRLLAVNDVKESLVDGTGPHNIHATVNSIIRKAIDRISEFMEGMDDRLDGLEVTLLENLSIEERARVSGLRREIAKVRRNIAPQREALNSLLTLVRDQWSDEELFELREQMDRMLRNVEDLDLLRERAIVLHEQMMNLVMEQQNQRMYTLSIVAAIFLPATFVTGVFGMNVGGMPGLESQHSFLVITGSMVVVSAVIVACFKANRWL